MVRNSKLLLAGAGLVAVCGIVYFVVSRGSAPATPEPAAQSNEAVSALIKTASLQRQPLATTLTAFGDVTTGKVVAISFPRAGQVTLLPVQAGQRVAAGKPLATLSSDPSAGMAFAQAASALQLAQGELKRNRQLFALQLATQSQVDTAARAVTDAQSALAAQKAIGGDLPASTLTAPFDGVVVALNVAQGDRIAAGAPILQLGHSDGLRVQLGIEPSQSRLVKAGMSAVLSPLQNPGASVTGVITEVQNLVDQKTQLVTALAVLPPSAGRQFVPGMHAQAVIGIDKKDGWVVPRQAVLNDDNGDYVYQVVNGKAHRVTVIRGVENQETVGIEGKLDAKLPVVVLGNYELQEGMAVRETTP